MIYILPLPSPPSQCGSGWTQRPSLPVSCPLLAPCFSLNTISCTQSLARPERQVLPWGCYANLGDSSRGPFPCALALGLLGWGCCLGHRRMFLPLFMWASTVHFSQRNRSLKDFLNVKKTKQTRLPWNKYLRLTRKGDHHPLKHQPRNHFPGEGNEWITILCNICSAPLYFTKVFTYLIWSTQ